MKKMMFFEDKYLNLDVVYVKGVVYEIADSSVERWLKRGGVIVEEKIAAKVQEPAVHEASDTDILGDGVEEHLEEAPKKDKDSNKAIPKVISKKRTFVRR